MPPFAILFVQHGLKTCFLCNLADKGSINIHTLRFLSCHVQTEMPQTETIRLMVSAIYFVAVCFPKMSETRPFLNKDLKFFLGSIVSRIRTNWESCCLDTGFVQVVENLESHGI